MMDEAATSPLAMRRHQRTLLDMVQANSSLRTSVEVALALDAADWYAGHTDRALPEVLAMAAVQEYELPSPVSAMQRAWLESASEPEISQYLPTLAREFALSAHNGEYLSSPSITSVAVTAALTRARQGGSPLMLLDLAVGTGTTLLATAQTAAGLGHSLHALAQDLNPDMAMFAAATMFLGGVESHVHMGDSLVTDPFPDVLVDIAVSQPPFGLSWTRNEGAVRQQHQSAGWYRWGLPQKSDSTWLFASRLIEKLRRPENGGGRAVMFMAPGSLQRHGADDDVRKAVLEDDLIETVIGLPGRLSPLTDILLYALVFANNKPDNRKGKIQVVNLRPYFETSRDRQTAPRDLTPEAFDVLANALRSVKPGAASRTIPVEYFIRRRVRVRSHGDPQGPRLALDENPLEWDIDVPGTETTEAFLSRRYGPMKFHSDTVGKSYCPLEIDSVFDETLRKVSRWGNDLHWSTTRLSALLTDSPIVLGQVEGSSEAQGLLLPTSVRGDASAGGEVAAPQGSRVLQLHTLTDLVSTDFLAGWLNSALGRDCRRRAHDLGSSGTVISAVRTEPRSLIRYLDELVVPVPPMTEQDSLAAAERRLVAVSHIVENSRRNLWNTPFLASQAVRRFDSLFDQSLATWAGELPFPVASALWTLESKRSNTEAAHKQMFLVWEAYAAFTGTMLLSALSQDPVMHETEVPRLREALYKARLSMENATLGTWSVVVQRLGSCFRTMLQSEDADDRARVLQTFGSPSYDTLTRLLDTSVVRVLNDVNAKRNLWDGHTGSVAEPELQRHIEYLDSRLEELRDIIGTAWLELLCVVAGDGFKRGGNIVQKVELAVGPNTPFRRTEIGVGELMEKRELYLATEGAAQPLPLEHLVVLRTSPDGARYACYFYNRLEGADVRMVSYHSADKSELTEHLDDVLAALGDLAASGSDI